MTDTVRRGSPHPPVGRRGDYRNEDFFDADELDRVRAYVRPLRRVRRIRLGLSMLLSVWLVFGLDVGPEITGWVGDQGWAIRLLVVVAVVEAIDVVVRAPFGWWVNLVYEKRAGHSTMTAPLWLKDQVLEIVLSTVISFVLFAPVYAAIHRYDQWWLLGGLLMVAVQIVGVFVAPVLIMPRFNKFTPLEDGPIRRRIEELAAEQGVTIGGVFLMDASKRTTRANAGVTGFGKTKRVIVNDTICTFPIDELSQVIAHELGHYRLNHIPKSFPIQALQLPLALLFVRYVAGNDTVLGWAGIDDLGDPASYPLVGLAVGIPLTAWSLLTQWLSRKHEREADLEALELLRDPSSFLSVWPRMVLTDKANLEPTPWERLTATHPEVAERMQFGIDWARMNGIDVTLPPRRRVPDAQPT